MSDKPYLKELEQDLTGLLEWYKLPLVPGEIGDIASDDDEDTERATRLLNALPHLLRQARRVAVLEGLLAIFLKDAAAVKNEPEWGHRFRKALGEGADGE